jgi:hypothetical protein
MPGPLDRFLEFIYRRGQALAGAEDRITEERREAVRAVRRALTDAMTSAERHRETGLDDHRHEAITAANHASSVVQEISDERARELVATWKTKWEAIPKFYKEAGTGEWIGSAHPPGYPEPAWSELKEAHDGAQERLGAVLRELMESRKR